MEGMQFSNGKEIEEEALRVLRATPLEVFERELEMLLQHCQAVIENAGEYIL